MAKVKTTSPRGSSLSRRKTRSSAAVTPAVQKITHHESQELHVDPVCTRDAEEPTMPSPSLKGDWANFLLLLGLYTLQGIPIGLASSVPMYLNGKGVDFSGQAFFSLASWPYSLKLLWAPLVDGLFTTKFGLGQRKSWVIPTQFVAGIVMILLSARLDAMFGGSGEASVDVHGLTYSFFALYFLVATQDIAVDGWALTMLRPENVGYASTANNVGQTLGITLAFGILMALDSTGFCNRYLRPMLGLPLSEKGMVNMAEFLWFWGAVFIVSTCLLWAWKTEKHQVSASTGLHSATGSSFSETMMLPEVFAGDETAVLTKSAASSDKTTMSTTDVNAVHLDSTSSGSLSAALEDTWKNYTDLYAVLQISNVRTLVFVLATSKMAFTAIDSASTLIMQNRGLQKETVALFDMVSTPALLAVQLAISHLTSGPRPLSLMMKTYIARLAFSVAWLGLIYGLMPAPGSGATDLPGSTKLAIFLLQNGHSLVVATMFLTQISFFTQIADPRMGGTYMTLLNTVSNLGSKWPQYVLLRCIAWLTESSCGEPAIKGSCEEQSVQHACKAAGSTCHTDQDGFLIVTLASTFVGFAWWILMRKTAVALESKPRSDWRLPPP